MIDIFNVILGGISIIFALIFSKLLYDIKKIEKEDLYYLKKEIATEEDKINEIEKKLADLDIKINEKASIELVKYKLEELRKGIVPKNKA